MVRVGGLGSRNDGTGKSSGCAGGELAGFLEGNSTMNCSNPVFRVQMMCQ